MNIKLKKQYLEITNYLIFIIPYFLIQPKLLIASLIFLYGFPVGTLIEDGKRKKEKRS